LFESGKLHSADIGDVCGSGTDGATQCGANAHCADDYAVQSGLNSTKTPPTSVRQTCVCNPGFVGDGEICTDIDECEAMKVTGGSGQRLALASCDPERSVCVNLPGGYRCDCLPGFIGDGVKCEGVNSNAIFHYYVLFLRRPT